jgi:hypothetical protein
MFFNSPFLFLAVFVSINFLLILFLSLNWIVLFCFFIYVINNKLSENAFLLFHSIFSTCFRKTRGIIIIHKTKGHSPCSIFFHPRKAHVMSKLSLTWGLMWGSRWGLTWALIERSVSDKLLIGQTFKISSTRHSERYESALNQPLFRAVQIWIRADSGLIHTFRSGGYSVGYRVIFSGIRVLDYPTFEWFSEKSNFFREVVLKKVRFCFFDISLFSKDFITINFRELIIFLNGVHRTVMFSPSIIKNFKSYIRYRT